MEPIDYYIIIVLLVAGVVIAASFHVGRKWKNEDPGNKKVIYKKKKK